MKAAIHTLWVVLIVCLALPSASFGDDGAEEKRLCLKCHGKTEAVKRFPDGGFITAYVDSRDLDGSVHASLRCTACHREFSAGEHPDRAFRSKLQYRIKESSVCRDCHPDASLRSRGVHEPLLRKEQGGEAVICTDCHGAHAVAAIAAGGVAATEERHCLGCHSRDGRMTFSGGDSISLLVSTEELGASSHRNLSCSDCHFGFSSEEHPHRRFRSGREHRLASSDICRRCHFDKYSKVSESIHHAMLDLGKLNAPNCVDCHGGHAVTSLGKDRLSVVRKCRSCHNETYEIYSKSVHGSALFMKNNKDVPTCIDCHTSHSIKDPYSADFHDYIPDMCSNCHSNAALMGKYGLSVDVVKTYLSDFHGVTLSLSRKEAQRRYPGDRPMAVCTDCHGTHDIAAASGADVQAIKKKLHKRCKTCHTSASENFPEAWLSHYKPSLTVAPLVFIVEQFYKIMMPVMAVGLLFHILLHIWRYLVNR